MIEQGRELYGAASPQALAAETYENYKRYVNPPLARVMKLSGSPVEVRAHGCTIWDHTGKAYLDFAGGYGVFTLGYTHPRVVAAVRAQLELIALSGKTMFNVLLGRAARRLAELAPGDLQISFWCNSGTEAIEGAIKLARAATGRAKIVSTRDAYHGKTLGALSVSGRESFQSPFRPLLADSVCVPYGDAAVLEPALRDAAAFVVEPVQGEGGVNVPPVGYLKAVREACDTAGALFVADEVQTGLGRCGYRFGCDRDGVVPDVMTLAKGLSGGVVPVGAFIAKAGVWERAFGDAPLVHTSTFGGAEIACAAALAAMDVLEEDALARRARERGEQLLRGAQAIAGEFPAVVREARGLGLLVGVELTHEGYGGYVIPEMLKAGVTAAWTLNQQRVIRLEPPLVVTESEIDCALAALRAGIAAAYEKLGDLSA
ncbi:MAG: aspartate aminotransferase family protein [Candidatus Eremiobacteraeota bacterium]|nr:aspartate aminotransferase family protein [Candidatus Eremiobacteraeota bacterium]MBV8499133.1 aspartate aminotransferase family protein [Candidatus Eremiobacteraeota bacterium]